MARSKLMFAAAAFLTVSLWGFGQVSAETTHDPAGIWLTQAGDAKIRVNHCGSGLCGTIAWLKVPLDPRTGKPQIDDKNANPSLANRPIIGINIFSKMKSVANNKWSGTIYNADDGKSYSSDVIVAEKARRARLPDGDPVRRRDLDQGRRSDGGRRHRAIDLYPDV